MNSIFVFRWSRAPKPPPLGITSQQELLLKAAILPPENAINFWNEWTKNQHFSQQQLKKAGGLTGVFVQLDYDSRRLLPLVYYNLKNSGDPLISSLRSNYEYNLVKGKYLLSGAAKVTEALQRAGFDVMLLKGMPIALLYYQNLGLRPMDDIDIFIPPHQIEQAITFLENDLNFTINQHENELRKLGMLHAIQFTDGKLMDLDLHCHFHIYNLNAESDQPMWDQKIALRLTRGVATYTLSPTHQLYRNFTHGFPWILSGASIRWVPDSVYIINKHPDNIDWEGLFDLSAKQKMILPVCSMLRYLKRHYDVQFPKHVTERINLVNGSKVEQYYFELLLKAAAHKGSEWEYFNNKIIRILFRYYLYQERDIRDSFPVWLVKRIKYTSIFKKL